MFGDAFASPAFAMKAAERSGYAPTELQEVVMEDSQVAAALSAQLAERIGAQRFELWFASQTRLCIVATRLTIHAASAFVRDWLRKNFARDISECWEAVAGSAATVEFEIDETLKNAADDDTQPSNNAVEKPVEQATTKQAASDVPSEPRVAFTLARFVVGSENEYAFRAADLTASGLQQASPITLSGPTGVGKTHLQRAILSEYRRRNPRSTAIYLSAEQFTTCFVEAIRGSGLPSFRQKCRGANLLIIDDLQFFLGKQRTIEELQYTVDTMLSEGRQLVLSSDRSLVELRGLGQELCSRLAGGLICEIEPPGMATRLGIVRRLNAEMGLKLGDEIQAMVAAQIHAGARELRGALYRFQAMHQASGQPISRAVAEQALTDLARHSSRAVRLADVQKAVCEVFGVEPAQLRSDRKGRALSEPRMLGMWLARKYTRAPWSEIGECFGRRSHSTVISAHRRVEQLIRSRAQIGLSDRSCTVEEAIRKVEAVLRTA